MELKFINELSLYAKKKHAEIVFKKCLKAGKLKIAQKIAWKYEIQIKGPSDIVMATGMAMIANEKLNNL